MRDRWLWIIGLVLLFGGGGYAVYTMTRGLRNNNPGNIRRDGTTWQGMDPQQTDAEFVRFTAPEYGIRAMYRILASYAARGQDSVREIISTWAPPSENDTASYIASVAGALGVNPDQPLPLSIYAPALIGAIIRHENGVNPYSDSTIQRGIALA